MQEIDSLLAESGFQRFRSKQLKQWIYGRGAVSYDKMTNLPANMRDFLNNNAPLNIPIISDRQISRDGSRKYVLTLSDGLKVETVGIPSFETNAEGNPKRLTVCFSTQVGCPMQCSFCATGTEGFTRNLFPGEMVQQVLSVQRDFNMKPTNVVAMGQGEPFLNYNHFIDALHILNNQDALNIGARHITVSTCGIINGIEHFSHEPEQFTLAVSLHAARQNIRDHLMPQCRTMSLNQLKAALQHYSFLARRRITFEYLMINQINDTENDLSALISYCKGLHVHVNLIPLNKISGSKWVPSSNQTMQKWAHSLNANGIEATIRNSRGSDIDGACGQLKNNISEI